MEGGVQTKQRKVGDRFYVPSFSGSDAVDWVKKEKNLVEREHAQRILQRLLRASVIKSIKLPTSTAEPNFDDTPKAYYYFAVRHVRPISQPDVRLNSICRRMMSQHNKRRLLQKSCYHPLNQGTLLGLHP
jgi:hypothetical protein